MHATLVSMTDQTLLFTIYGPQCYMSGTGGGIGLMVPSKCKYGNGGDEI